MLARRLRAPFAVIALFVLAHCASATTSLNADASADDSHACGIHCRPGYVLRDCECIAPPDSFSPVCPTAITEGGACTLPDSVTCAPQSVCESCGLDGYSLEPQSCVCISSHWRCTHPTCGPTTEGNFSDLACTIPRAHDAGTCVTPVDAGTIPCGTQTCNAATQYCQDAQGGVDSGMNVDRHRCVDYPSQCACDHSCDCVTRYTGDTCPQSPWNTCRESSGAVYETCNFV
jgi:hypothetical protein